METSLKQESIIGPMGSTFHRIKVPPNMQEAINWDCDWNKFGKRVLIDPIGGIITWMSPDTTHSTTADLARLIVFHATDQVKLGGDNRWQPPNAVRKIEADASFYIGENAERYYAAIRDVEDEDEAEKMFFRQNPPDLVIEVEVTNYDKDKPGLYADLGVREMWQINRSKRAGSKPVQATILNLQAEGGLREVDQSLVLPGLKASTLPKAFHLARHNRFPDLQALLKNDLVVPGPPKTPPSSSFKP